MDCVFCKIVSKEIPSKNILETDNVLAFYDAHPQAPIHFLVIPKMHIDNFIDIPESSPTIINDIFKAIKTIALNLNIKNGLRIINNYGKQGGQTVNHLHFHILAGRDLTWPPG